MSLKDVLYKKQIKQVYLVKELGVDPTRVSLHVNGILPLPKKYHTKFCELTGLSQNELASYFPKHKQIFKKK
jgi:hypothetical protein